MAPPTIRPTQSADIAPYMPVITGFAAVAYAVAVYWLLFLPKIDPLLEGGSLDASRATSVVADDEAYVRRLDAAIGAYDKVNADIKEKVAGIVPADMDVPGLFVQLDALAKGQNLVLSSIDVAPDDKIVAPSGKLTVRVSANVAGGLYAQLKALLTDIERSRRLFDVQTLTYTPGSGGFNFVIRTYYLDKDAVVRARQPQPTYAVPGVVAPAP